MSQERAGRAKTQLGLDVRTGTLLAQNFPDHVFDVVTMFHYFEHEIHPLPILQEARRTLKERGLLVVELPNVNSPLFRLFKSYWAPLDIPRHVVHYCANTLVAMLNRTGFDVVAVTYHPPTFMLASLLNFLGVVRFLLGLSLNAYLVALCLALPFLPAELACRLGFRLLRTGDTMTVCARPTGG